MSRVKELHEERIKRKTIADEIREKIREELSNINSPYFSNWRYDLSEAMTTSSFMSTTLLPTGDAINFTINSAQSDAYNLTAGNIEGSWVELTGNGPDQQSFDYGNGNGAFPGAIDSALYFSVPFDGVHTSSTSDFFYATTKPFEVRNNSLTFSAIAGNSSSNAGGVGSNGGTLPYDDLSVYWYVYNDDGTFSNAGLLGTIPKTTSSLTNFTFDIPTELSGKTIALNFYSNANGGANFQYSWLNGENVSFHPTALIDGSPSDIPSRNTTQEAYMILNYDKLPANSYFKQFSKNSLALGMWTKLQRQYTGDNDWGETGNTTLGYPAPASGGRTGYLKGSSPMSEADLSTIVSNIANQFSSQYGMNTTTYALGNVNFKRTTPMNVFVSLDSPEASAFIRTDPTIQGLSAEDRKKKLIDMLDAGDEYLLKYLGITGSSARPSDTIMPSWDQAQSQPGPDSGTMRNLRPSGAERSDKNMTWDDHMNDWVPNIGPGDLLKKASSGSGDTQIARIHDGPHDSPNDVQFPGRKSKPGPGHNPQTQPVRSASNRRRQPVFTHYEPEGEVLSEKKKLKSPKDITSKIPGYYDGKPAPLGFPMQEPPKTINGYHPDLVDGKKVSNRYNRLDPISAKSMPKTGNPHIDKKVAKAQKKAK